MWIFISYSRTDETFARKLVTSLSSAGTDIWIDVEDIPPGMNWSSAIQQGLKSCEIMLPIMSPASMESENVADEWQYFRDKKKVIIPVFWKPCEPHFQLSRLQYVDFHEQIYEKALGQLFRRLDLKLPTADIPVVSAISASSKLPKLRSRLLMVVGLVVVMIGVVSGFIILLSGGGDKQNQSDGQGKTEVALDLTDTPTNTPSPTSEASATNSTFATLSPTDEPTDTLTATATETSTSTNTPSPTDTPSSTPSLTNTSTVTLSATASATLPLGFEQVTSNAQWKDMGGPIEQDFDGVTMVLVPAGCFDMGSMSEQRDYAVSLGVPLENIADEIPVTKICFDAPFWIDKYEVTKGDFARLGGVAANDSNFTGVRLPRENVTWFEARDFCEQKRGGRLPTEAEWEYAARGLDELIFPWGNGFEANNVVYYGNSSSAAEVGSKEGGVSWVGTYDSSGNVWEWVSSLYLPYDSSQDRENYSDNINSRVVRGGSSYFVINLCSAFRNWYDPNDVDYGVGFRCARAY